MINSEDITTFIRSYTAISLLTTIFEHTTRGVHYELYPIDSICVYSPITKVYKGLLYQHVIYLFHQVNVIQIVNKIIQIHNSAANNCCNLLADQSI